MFPFYDMGCDSYVQGRFLFWAAAADDMNYIVSFVVLNVTELHAFYLIICEICMPFTC